MGYKKLDEVKELLSDELDGFNKSINRLEKLTQNVENIKIKPDTAEIERMLLEHLVLEKEKNKSVQESMQNVSKQIAKARSVPKVQLLLQYSIWIVSLVIIGYLVFRVSRIENIQEKAFTKGKEKVILNLRGYFDQNPEHYRIYQKWVREKDSVPNQK